MKRAAVPSILIAVVLVAVAVIAALADELIRLKVEIIVAGGTNAALAARDATRAIPVVFLNMSDPVSDGLIDSLARPDGNMTGFTIISGVLARKRLELLKETVPKLTRVAVLWDPKNRSSAGQWKENQLAARDLGLQLHSMEISSADKIESAFEEAAKARCAALTVTQNPVLTSSRKQVVDLAAKYRLPAIYHEGEFVEIGGVMSYGPDPVEPYRRAATYVDKILKGRSPPTCPLSSQRNLSSSRI